MASLREKMTKAMQLRGSALSSQESYQRHEKISLFLVVAEAAEWRKGRATNHQLRHACDRRWCCGASRGDSCKGGGFSHPPPPRVWHEMPEVLNGMWSEGFLQW